MSSAAVTNDYSYRVAIQIRESEIVPKNELVRYAYASPNNYTAGEMRLSYNYYADVIRGDVHTNGRTIFGRYYNNAWNPMGASIIGNVTAVRGVGSESIYLDEYDNTINTFLEGNLGLGSVSGTVNGYAASIAFPTQAQITTDLQTSADDYPDYFIHGSNPLYQPYRDTNSLNMPYEVHMTLLGNQVQLDFRGPASSITAPGPLLYTRTLPLPDHKLIYVEGRVTIKGDINGRLTVATSGANIYGNIVIGGNIRYVDNEGDRAYLLKKNGVVVDPEALLEEIKNLVEVNAIPQDLIVLFFIQN